MSPRLQVANRATALLDGDIADDDEELTVDDSSLFPSAPFRITIGSEIIEVGAINKVTHVFSELLRAQEDTDAAAHLNGAAVTNRWTKGAVEELADYDETASDKVTTAGDIVYATAADTLARLGIGTARQVLQTNSGATAPQWAASPQSVLTAQGDLLYASAANTLARLAKGTANQVLRMNAGATAPEWESPASAATASALVRRDDAGRAKVAAPSAEDDIALKSNVTTVQTNLTTHENNTTTAHGAVSTATASKLVVRDASGRAAFAAPAAAGDAAILSTVTDHAALTTAHGAVSAATASKIVVRDASGRAAFADGAAAGDAVNKGQLDTKEATITAGTTAQYYRGDKSWATLLGETDATAYPGDKGKTAYDYSQVGHVPLTRTVSTTTPLAGGGALSGDLTLTHADTDGYKHVPSGGAAGQWLKYSAAGTAAWTTLLGETSATAYRGDRGKAAYDHSQTSHAYLPLAGGTMTGILYPQNNTSYTTGQARRIILSTEEPSGGGTGDVWVRYTA